MAEDIAAVGQKFSIVYLRADEVLRDSSRMRMRIAKLFQYYAPSSNDRDTQFGRFVERELGVKVLSHIGFFNYEEVLAKVEIRDLLDMVTLFWRFLDLAGQKYSFRQEVGRIFQECQVAYRLDDDAGVHPAFDNAFEIVRSAAIRGLSGAENSAERSYLENAENALMAEPIDGRQAIRSTFDALENYFKKMYPGAPRLTSQFIVDRLKPELEAATIDDPQSVERKASFKSIDSFKAWVDGAHFYRHAAGEPVPNQPSQQYAILVVSQGLGFLRWMVDLNQRRS